MQNQFDVNIFEIKAIAVRGGGGFGYTHWNNYKMKFFLKRIFESF
jgi:hypothetical protein